MGKAASPGSDSMVDGRHVTNDAAGQRKTVYGNSHKEVAGQLAQGLTTKDDIAEF